jgi:hypothetical protein
VVRPLSRGEPIERANPMPCGCQLIQMHLYLIYSLSNRFSVLKMPEQDSNPFSSAGPVPPLPPGAFTLDDMKKRFAQQRTTYETGDYLTEQEEAAVLADLEDNIRMQQQSSQASLERFQSLESDEAPASSASPPLSYRPTGRGYGFGSSDAMREADVMRNAKETVRNRQQQSPLSPRRQIGDREPVADRFEGQDSAGGGSRSTYTRAPSTRGHTRDNSSTSLHERKSVLETMSPAAQQRISRAILQVEADMLNTASVSAENRHLPSNISTARLPTTTPTKRVGNDRRNVSISRSPAFHDHLADAVAEDEILVDKAGMLGAVTATRNDDDGPAQQAGSIDVFTVDNNAAAGSTKPFAKLHWPEPLALGKPITLGRPITLSANGGPEAHRSETSQANQNATQLLSPDLYSRHHARHNDGPTTAASILTDGTGSYVAETPPETALHSQQSLAVPGQDSLPSPHSPQDYAFDIAGYYGDEQELNGYDDTHGTTHAEREPINLGSPARSVYSSDYQPSADDPASFAEDAYAHALQSDASPRANQAELGLSLNDFKRMQEKLNEAARNSQRDLATVSGQEGAPGPSASRNMSPVASHSGQAQQDVAVHTSHAEGSSIQPATSPDIDRSPETRPDQKHYGEPTSHHPFSSPPPGRSINESPVPLASPIASNGPQSPQRFGNAAPSVEADDREGAKSRLAQALFGPTEALGGPPSPVGPTHTHRRMESTSSARSYRIDEDPDVRRDFEARIAQATAALQKTPSVRLSRKNTRNKAIKIGSPTLLQTSATLQVSPLTSPQMGQGGFSPTGNSVVRGIHQRSGHGKSASTSSLSHVQPAPPSPKTGSSASSGLKGLLAKMKRKPSQKRALKESPAAAAAATAPHRSAAPPIPAAGVKIPPDMTADARKARRSIIRRTIVVPTNLPPPVPSSSSNALQSEADQNQAPIEPSRRPSVKRKPVHRTSEDKALEQELLAPPLVQRVASLGSKRSVESGRDSLYELYGESEDQSQLPGQSASQGNRATLVKPTQVLEIREMSDGEVTWGLVDGVDEASEDTAVWRPQSRIASQYGDSLIEQSSTSSYRKPSMASNNFDLDEDDAAWSVAERELLESPVERPKTKASVLRLSSCFVMLNLLFRNNRSFTRPPQTFKISWLICQPRTPMATLGSFLKTLK